MAYKKIHQACPDCGSRDALAVNEDGSTKCYSCGTYRRDSVDFSEETYTEVSPQAKKPVVRCSDAFVGGLTDRRLTTATMTKYDVMQNDNGNIYFPYYGKDGELTAYKVRTPEKKFSVEGDFKSALLFGQNVFPKGGKVVTLCEGEIDAMSAFQMLSVPSVSVRSGAQSALSDCKAAYEWLDSFERIVICFDNDEAGKEATKKVAELFGAKACLFRHIVDYKDANDWLVRRSEIQFGDGWRTAEAYKPEGIVTVRDIKERLLKPPVPGVP